MSQDLNILLNKYRDASKSEREKGDYFELLAKDFLKNDPVYTQQYSDGHIRNGRRRKALMHVIRALTLWPSLLMKKATALSNVNSMTKITA
jgi:hypothetical protein